MNNLILGNSAVRILLSIYLIAFGNLFAQEEGTIKLNKITENVWVHTTYKDFNGYLFPSNGLIIITNSGGVLIDPPWNVDQTHNLLKEIKKKLDIEIILGIITHAHDDRIGGIGVLKEKNIKAVSSALTAKLGVEQNFAAPSVLNNIDTTLKVGDKNIELYFPGAGHTIDNIVVWLPQSKILFGGCLVKSAGAKNLGNIKDADVKEWPKSVKKVLTKFNDAEIVVPGHGRWGDKKLLTHTLRLLHNADL